jgi:hypothetical protein
MQALGLFVMQPIVLESTVMSLLSYRCPATSKEIRTGIDTDPTRLAKMGSLKVAVACPYCPEGHIVTAESLFISDDLQDLSESPNREARRGDRP